MPPRCSLLAGFLLLTLPWGLAAQRSGAVPLGPSKTFFGIAGAVALPQEEFDRYVGNGYGLGLNLAHAIDDDGVILLRIDAGFLRYGNETKGACFEPPIGCLITLEVSTSNDIITGGIGPQLALPLGRVRLSVIAEGGFAYFFTHSSVRGSGDIEPFADTKNYDDATFAWLAGGSFQIALRGGRKPIYLDLNGFYHDNGKASYLREGGITSNPDGSVTIRPIRSNTNFITIQLGVSFGL
jgi:hypothetical protein